MSNFISLVVLTVIAFSFGAVVGETYAPLSGETVHALKLRVDDMERRLEAIEKRLSTLDPAVERGLETLRADGGTFWWKRDGGQ